MSCHEIGKSFTAALVACWWIDTHPPGEAFVVTSAPSASQVRTILWREIGRAHARAGLPGRTNQTSWQLVMPAGNEEIVALGRKPDEYDPTAFQGIHAKYVLVIFDEANGIRGNLHEAADSLIANDESKMLMISNPDDPSGEYYDNCKPASGYHVISISAFDTPNFTGEDCPEEVRKLLIGHRYVEEKRKKWARNWYWVDAAGNRLPDGTDGAPVGGVRVVCPDGHNPQDTHPFWQSKILGVFPATLQQGSLIPLPWILAAQQRTLEPVGPHELGLDVGASEDGDPTCLGEHFGPVFRVVYEQREPDTMKTTGRMLQYLEKSGAARCKVDYIGVGRGVVDRSREQGKPVIPVSVGNKSSDPKEFADLLSELWWQVREKFEHGEIDLDPQDEDLAAELLIVQWEPKSDGTTKVFYGDGPSPNRADSLLFTCSVPPEPKKYHATWGR